MILQSIIYFQRECEDILDFEKAFIVIKKWEKEQIFHPNFLNKLRLILNTKYEQLKKDQENFIKFNSKDPQSNKILKSNLKII